jgi:hypothetical protein
MYREHIKEDAGRHVVDYTVRLSFALAPVPRLATPGGPATISERSSRPGKGLALSGFLTGARADQRIDPFGSFVSLPKHGTRPNRCSGSSRQSGESSSGHFQGHEEFTFFGQGREPLN